MIEKSTFGKADVPVAILDKIQAELFKESKIDIAVRDCKNQLDNVLREISELNIKKDVLRKQLDNLELIQKGEKYI